MALGKETAGARPGTNTRARALRQSNATGGREPPRRDGAGARGGSEGKMAPWVWKSLGVLCTGSGFHLCLLARLRPVAASAPSPHRTPGVSAVAGEARALFSSLYPAGDAGRKKIRVSGVDR